MFSYLQQMTATSIALSKDRPEPAEGDEQTVITVRREPKARLKLLLQHTPAARPMIDIVSDALDAITIPELQKRGLMPSQAEHAGN